MNRIAYPLLLSLLILATLFAGCNKEQIITPNDNLTTVEVLPDGRLRIPLTLNVRTPKAQEIATRATTNDNKIESIHVLVFAATDDQPLPDSAPLLQNVQATLVDGTNQAYVILAPYADKVQLRVLTNLSAATKTTLAGFKTTTTDPASPTTFDQFKDLTSELDAFYLDKAHPGGAASNLRTSYTMSSERIYLANISVNTMPSITANLQINAARIDISSSVSGFVIEGVQLINGAQQGYLRPHDPLPVNLGTTIQYNEVTAVSGTISPIYLFPNNGVLGAGVQGSNPTYLILRASQAGVTGYYKIAIRYDKAGADLYDIVRNTRYTLSITKVKSIGYTTADDAIANTPANISYDISVDDGSSSDIVISNGQYYLGIDNTEVWYYGAPAGTLTLANITVGTATGQSLPAGNRGTITVSGSGVSGVNPNLLQSVISGSTTPLTATLAHGANATITIRFGDIEKKIQVRNFAPVITTVNQFLPFADATQAVVATSDDNSLRLNTSTAYPTSYSSELNTTTPTTIYLCTPASVSAERTSTIFITRANNAGRLRAIVRQIPAPTTFTMISDSYVGAFWRASQTGERIIRVPAGTSGTWDAQLLWMDGKWGGDRVRFSTAATADPNVDFTNDNSAADMNNPANDAAYNINADITSAAADGHIYFRMSVSAPNLGAKPRYAVVLLRYDNLTKNHLIYLRQGEQADQVSSDSNVEWLPYNVGNYADPMQYGYDRLTGYPSQAGYFKQHTTETTMYDPVFDVSWEYGTKGVIANVCPHGYKIPTTNGKLENPGTLVNKGQANEIGSLFGGTNIGMSNHIFGYYADGFFDRYRIQNSGAVRNTRTTIAYRGYLVLNPTTKASIFLPAAGYREYGLGGLEGAYNDIKLWAINSTAPSYIFKLSSTSVLQYFDYDWAACMVRCIRE